jgi:hypothetical protein
MDKIRATDKCLLQSITNFRSQLQECISCQEDHLDVILKKIKIIH